MFQIDNQSTGNIFREKKNFHFLIFSYYLKSAKELQMTLEYNRQEAGHLDARYAELVQKLNHLERSLEELRFKNEDRKQQVLAELDKLRYENEVYAGELDYWERVQRVHLDAEIQAYRSLLNFQLKLLQNGGSSDIVISSTSTGGAGGAIGFVNGGHHSATGNYGGSSNAGSGNYNSNYNSSYGNADRNNNGGSNHYLNGGSTVHGNFNTSHGSNVSGGNYNTVGELISRPLDYNSKYTLSSTGGGVGLSVGVSSGGNYNAGNYSGLGANNNPNFANSSRIQASSREQNYVLTPHGVSGTHGDQPNVTATQLVNQVIHNAHHQDNRHLVKPAFADGNKNTINNDTQIHSSSHVQGLICGVHGNTSVVGGSSGGGGGGRVTGTLGTAGGVSTVTTSLIGVGGSQQHLEHAIHHQQPLIATTTVANNITQTSASSSIVRGAAYLEDKSHFSDRSKSDTIAGFFYFD
jgi:hypothetical protein